MCGSVVDSAKIAFALVYGVLGCAMVFQRMWVNKERWFFFFLGGGGGGFGGVLL